MLQVGDQRTAASSFQVTARGSHRLAEIDPNVLVAIASRASTVMRRMASIIAQSIFSPIPLSGVTLFDSFEKTTVQDARVHESSTPRLKKKLVRKPSAAWCWRRRFLLLAKEDSRHHQPPLRARLLKAGQDFMDPLGTTLSRCCRVKTWRFSDGQGSKEARRAVPRWDRPPNHAADQAAPTAGDVSQYPSHAQLRKRAAMGLGPEHDGQGMRQMRSD
jgi:hypothetical protein